jgi:hypothetical protein
MRSDNDGIAESSRSRHRKEGFMPKEAALCEDCAKSPRNKIMIVMLCKVCTKKELTMQELACCTACAKKNGVCKWCEKKMPAKKA